MTRQDLIFDIILVVWSIIMAILLLEKNGSLLLAMDVLVILGIGILIFVKWSSEKFQKWLEKPLKRDKDGETQDSNDA